MAYLLNTEQIERFILSGMLPPFNGGPDDNDCIRCGEPTARPDDAWCRPCHDWLACRSDDEPPRQHGFWCVCGPCTTVRENRAVPRPAETNARWVDEDAAWLSTGTAA